MAIRIGILGCARIARTALLDIAKQIPEIEIFAIASRSLATSRTWADRYGIGLALEGYDALIGRDDIDAIYVPLPNSLHADWTIRAIEAGKAVLCEKPLASNAAEAATMVAAAQRTGRLLVEAFHYRYHPLALFIEQAVRGGELGQLLQVEAAFEIPGQLVPANDIRFQRDLAGGALMDVGAYCINAVRWIAGREPVVVEATAQRVGDDVDDAMHARLELGGGATADIRCSLKSETFNSSLVIRGSRGTLTVKNPFVPQLGHEAELDCDGVSRQYTFAATPSYIYQARAFAACVRDGRPPLTSASNGVLNMQLIDAIYRKAGMQPRGL